MVCHVSYRGLLCGCIMRKQPGSQSLSMSSSIEMAQSLHIGDFGLMVILLVHGTKSPSNRVVDVEMTKSQGPQTPPLHVATRGPAADSKTSVWLQRGDEVPPRADGDYRRPLISPTERRGRRQSLLPRVESRSNSLNPPPARPGGPRVQITSSAV